MVRFEAVLDSKGIIQVVVKGDNIEEIAESIPDALSLFSKNLKRTKSRTPAKQTTGEQAWIIDNISEWQKNKERDKIVYSIFLMNDNKPLLLDQINKKAENLGVDLKDWLAHNFKRDMEGDVVETAREGRKRYYQLSALGIKKANGLQADFSKS